MEAKVILENLRADIESEIASLELIISDLIDVIEKRRCKLIILKRIKNW